MRREYLDGVTALDGIFSRSYRMKVIYQWMLALNGTSGDFWVFGYGSLMWNPGFAHEEAVKARLYGYHRALCIKSRHYRGTPERSGLVMGLDRGGSCVGMAFRVAARDEAGVIDYLHQREMISYVYRNLRLGIRTGDGRKVTAMTFVADQKHEQFAGHLSAEEAAKIVRGAHGSAGPNEEYVFNTLTHLREIGISDPWLESVGRLIKAG
jgi:glutathione-specific gamma-glutamylcyclotransferase